MKRDNNKNRIKIDAGTISKEVFDREVLLCVALSAENGGKCSWGECEKCGVIPFLVKLSEGRLLENSGDINNIRNKYLSLSKSLTSSA